MSTVLNSYRRESKSKQTKRKVRPINDSCRFKHVTILKLQLDFNI